MTHTTHTPVNDHPTLTHEMILDAIRTDFTGETLRRMADEAQSVGAGRLAEQLRGFATDREMAAPQPSKPPVCQHCGNRIAEWLSVNYVDGCREECLCCDECLPHMSEFATITTLKV